MLVMVAEYGRIDAVVLPVLHLLDHHDANTLNERCSTQEAKTVSENPTVENMVVWLRKRLQMAETAVPERMRLERLVLQEDSRSACEWSRILDA